MTKADISVNDAKRIVSGIQRVEGIPSGQLTSQPKNARQVRERRRFQWFLAPSGGVPGISGDTLGMASCTPYIVGSGGARTELLDRDGASQTLEVWNGASAIEEGTYFPGYWEFSRWNAIPVGSGESEAEIGTVDFIVDNFDRTAGGALGDLWFNDDAFLIESGSLAKSAIDGTASGISTSQKIAATALYLQKLTVGAYYIKITPSANPANGNLDAFGAIAASLDNPIGAVGFSGSKAASSSLNNALFYDPASRTSASQVDSQAGTGTGAILAHATGTTLDITFGTASLSIATGALPSLVGMYSRDTAASSVDYISQFKAWSASIPEPPDGESGHGTYDGSTFNYTDKYHAGGGYDPNA
ncbi:MAG: hypothetical protein AAGG48_14470 [Planctomycetota bacterium]